MEGEKGTNREREGGVGRGRESREGAGRGREREGEAGRGRERRERSEEKRGEGGRGREREGEAGRGREGGRERERGKELSGSTTLQYIPESMCPDPYLWSPQRHDLLLPFMMPHLLHTERESHHGRQCEETPQ